MSKKRFQMLAVVGAAVAMLAMGTSAFAAGSYTVQSGDNLSRIAQQFYGDGTKWSVIYEANKDIIKNPNIIFCGQVLVIPDTDEVTVAEQPEATETPAAATETPATATETPATATETPATATETPAAATETPAAATETPAAATETPATATETPTVMATVANASVGDIVYFGSYEQDNNTENGKEPVAWYVLDKSNGEATLLSVYLLDCQPYHENFVDITWENCTLRSWLNSEFYNMAFSKEEQAAIVIANVVNEDNPSYGTDGGNNTADKVWLLSIGESEGYFADDNSRRAEPTVYARARGVYTRSNGNSWWWLRSPGVNGHAAVDVSYNGGIDYSGYNVDDGNYGVRPALKVAY